MLSAEVMKMVNGGSKMTTYIFVGIAAILLIILVAFAWQGNKIPIMKNLIERQWAEQQKAIEDKHKAEIEIKDKQIEISENNLKVLSKNYSSLIKKIQDKAKQRMDIKPPKDEQEIVDRFDKLGYKAVVK
jgi:predicted PurR-regulated permease PerM